MPQERALILDRPGGVFQVAPATSAAPGPRQIAVRVRAVAINPVDRYMQTVSRLITPWLAYPAVLGSDVAGEVEAVGAEVSRFRIGDRVLGLALGTDKGRGAAEGAFQSRVLIEALLASPIPNAMAYEEAAVLPLGLSTAASGLFQSDHLALAHPTTDAAPAGRSVLVWGGATSVGANAIQLAAQAGYDVVTTASPRNHGFVAALGARAAFDRSSPTVVADLAAALHGREVAGALAIGEGSLGACTEVLRRTQGRRFIAVATPGVSFDTLLSRGGGRLRMAPFLVRMALVNARDAMAARRARVATRFIWGSSLKDNEVGRMIFEDFLPRALAEGRYVAAPPPLVSGEGLEAIPAALAAQAGVSARKVVVRLGASA